MEQVLSDDYPKFKGVGNAENFGIFGVYLFAY
jgi:hypothetical protein